MAAGAGRRRCWPAGRARPTGVRRTRRRPHCCSAGHASTGGRPFEDGENLARGLAKLGPATVVVKLGALGALGLAGDQVHQAPAAADHGGRRGRRRGCLRRRLPQSNWSRVGGPDCLRMGNICGAARSAGSRDWEGLPTREDLARQSDGEVIR